MKSRRLGNSGLALSELTLGTLTWGRDTPVHQAAAMYDAYVHHGGRTLDITGGTGDVKRDRLLQVKEVLAGSTLVRPTVILHSQGPAVLSSPTDMTKAPASRLALLEGLRRDVDTLGAPADVWVVHGPRFGVSTQEIAGAIVSAVEQQLTSYVALAGMDNWDLGGLTALLRNTVAPIVGLAQPFSLLRSKPRHSLLNHCAEDGIGFIALAPLASGALTGKYRHSTPADSRAASAHLAAMLDGYLGHDSAKVIEAVVRVADGLGEPPAAVATAWVLAQQAVATAVVGPRNEAQLEGLLDADKLRLPRELREALSDVSLA